MLDLEETGPRPGEGWWVTGWQNGPGNGIIDGMSKSSSVFRESKNK